MSKKWLYWGIVYVIAVAIFYFSSLSYPLGKDSAAGLSSWIFHIVEYAMLSLAVYFAFKSSKKLSNYRLNTLLFILLFAISDELHQMLVPGRITSLWDIGVDLAGSFIIMLL